MLQIILYQRGIVNMAAAEPDQAAAFHLLKQAGDHFAGGAEGGGDVLVGAGEFGGFCMLVTIGKKPLQPFIHF